MDAPLVILLMLILFVAGIMWEFACRDNMRELRGDDHPTTRFMDHCFPEEGRTRVRDTNQSSQLHYHVHCRNLEGVRALLKSGSDANGIDSDGDAPLAICAMSNGSSDIARELLEAGALVNARNARGLTALSLAVLSDNSQLVKFLLDAGADVDADSKDGLTPLMFAAQQGNTAMLQLLLNAGADAALQNRSGRTALEISTGGAETILKALQEPRSTSTMESNACSTNV